jgi:hypothetical protein
MPPPPARNLLDVARLPFSPPMRRRLRRNVCRGTLEATIVLIVAASDPYKIMAAFAWENLCRTPIFSE